MQTDYSLSLTWVLQPPKSHRYCRIKGVSDGTHGTSSKLAIVSTGWIRRRTSCYAGGVECCCCSFVEHRGEGCHVLRRVGVEVEGRDPRLPQGHADPDNPLSEYLRARHPRSTPRTLPPECRRRGDPRAQIAQNRPRLAEQAVCWNRCQSVESRIMEPSSPDKPKLKLQSRRETLTRLGNSRFWSVILGYDQVLQRE